MENDQAEYQAEEMENDQTKYRAEEDYKKKNYQAELRRLKGID